MISSACRTRGVGDRLTSSSSRGVLPIDRVAPSLWRLDSPMAARMPCALSVRRARRLSTT
jgi:hypothetical protein